MIFYTADGNDKTRSFEEKNNNNNQKKKQKKQTTTTTTCDRINIIYFKLTWAFRLIGELIV